MQEGLLQRLFGRDKAAGEPAHAGGDLELADIQGFILRGYRMPMVRHFLLTVATPAAARALLGRFVDGDEATTPQLTTAEEWQVGFAAGPGDDPSALPRRKPDYCLNLGITWSGMVAAFKSQEEQHGLLHGQQAFSAVPLGTGFADVGFHRQLGLSGSWGHGPGTRGRPPRRG